jgi:hypothetical protein
MQMKRTGSFATALVEWERFQEGSKTWPEWKSHMIEAYEIRETAGITATQGGYHGAANAVDDDDRRLDESLARLQLANNASMQGYQDNLSAVLDET